MFYVLKSLFLINKQVMHRKDLCEGGGWVTGKFFLNLLCHHKQLKRVTKFSNCGARAGEIFLNTSSLCANSQ